ncbi:MAG: DUF2505 family protein [Acidimicrobiales bacterium]
MRFEFEQVIKAPRAEVLDAYCDPAFYDALGSMPKLGQPVLLEREEVEESIRVKVRFTYKGQVSAPVRAVVDPSKLTWVIEAHVHRSTSTIKFVVVPDHYADRMTASGSDRFVDEGGGTRRVTEGVIHVHVPLVGTSAERGIVNGYREHLVGEAELLEEWLVP